MNKLVSLVAIGLLGAAVIEELGKPAAEREWHGELAGLVPYDFRPPTLERLLSRVWSPDDPAILMPNVFGVGWTVNVGRLVRLAQSR